MKKRKNKIVEATSDELYEVYLKSPYVDFMSWPEYKRGMENAGCKVIKEKLLKKGKDQCPVKETK